MIPSRKLNHLPKHIAIIMDGNGRWAEKHHKFRLAGHKKGALNAQRVAEILIQYQIPYLTLYAFSTENWNRPKAEIDNLFRLLEERLDEGIAIALNKGVKIHHLGKLDGLPSRIQEKIREAVEITQNNTQMNLGLAFNYGSRGEIVDAARRIVHDSISAQDIDESIFNQYLYTFGFPDPDLVIRTGGEKRLSNFLLWQAAYAEIYFTSVLWPDFNRREIDKALIAYSKRQRRFGRLSPR